MSFEDINREEFDQIYKKIYPALFDINSKHKVVFYISIFILIIVFVISVLYFIFRNDIVLITNVLGPLLFVFIFFLSTYHSTSVSDIMNALAPAIPETNIIPSLSGLSLNNIQNSMIFQGDYEKNTVYSVMKIDSKVKFTIDRICLSMRQLVYFDGIIIQFMTNKRINSRFAVIKNYSEKNKNICRTITLTLICSMFISSIFSYLALDNISQDVSFELIITTLFFGILLTIFTFTCYLPTVQNNSVFTISDNMPGSIAKECSFDKSCTVISYPNSFYEDVITSEFIEKFNKICRAYNVKKVTAAIYDNMITIAIPSSVAIRINRYKTIYNIYKQIKSVLEMQQYLEETEK